MDVKKEIFADNIGQISFTDGMVRFDYISMQPGEDGVSAAETARIIIPLSGFLSAAGVMRQLIDKLLENGVLAQREAVEEKPAKKTTRKSAAKSAAKSAETTAEKPARKPRKKAEK